MKRNRWARLPIAGLLALASAAAVAQAPTQTIRITGSNVLRAIEQEGALPLAVLQAEDLRQLGMRSAEEVLQFVTGSQTSSVAAGAIGGITGGATFANLRGIGPDKTLVLLDGRRLAPFGFRAEAVDLKSIPLAMIERVEVLLDGASAVYGTDAIGGVINFITRAQLRGAGLRLQTSQPQHAGGEATSGGLSAGFGDLESDGYNLFAAWDHSVQQSIHAADRAFAATGLVPSRGTIGAVIWTFPANFYQPSTGLFANPSAPECAPPHSLPHPFDPRACIYDFGATIDLTPRIVQDTFAARGSLRLGGDGVLKIDLLSTRAVTTAKTSADLVAGIAVAPDHPFYPASVPGLDPTQPVFADWLTVPAGGREVRSEARGRRAVADLAGTLGGFEVRAGLLYSDSGVEDAIGGGFVSGSAVREAAQAGRLNPFGAPTPEQLTLLESLRARGEVASARSAIRGIDLQASRELLALPAGAVVTSFGAEHREEDYRYDTVDARVLDVGSLGRSPYHVRGDRRIDALMAEALVPLTRTLDVQLALRSDRYSDAGSTTNPKLGFRFKPADGLIVRGSYNTGFRAPSLDQLYAPRVVSFSSGVYNDPVLCPDGVADPAQGGVQGRDCAAQVQVQRGGNAALAPETSRTTTLGIVLAPAKEMVLSADYWRLRLNDRIVTLPVETVLGNAETYGASIVRCSDLPASDRGAYLRCQGDNGGSRAIAYVATPLENRGAVEADGVDLAAAYRLRMGRFGRLDLAWDATWFHSYRFRTDPTVAFKENVGAYVGGSPVFRWQHAATAVWRHDTASARLAVRHKSGYRDQNNPLAVYGGPSYYQDVDPYTLVDLSFTAQPFSGFALTLGVSNLFNRDPPFSNQSDRQQRGYDPRYTDPTGRAYFVRGEYAFR